MTFNPYGGALNTNTCIYGLEIASELDLPGPVSTSGRTPELTIRCGETPAHLPNPSQVTPYFEAAPGTLLILFPMIGRFLVLEKGEVILTPDPSAGEDEIVQGIIGWALSAFLQMQGKLSMHAASLCYQNKAVLFSGEPGTGKSTLLSGFLNRGETMLADDLSIVSQGSDLNLWVLPGFPTVKLWPDSLDAMGLPKEGLRQVLPGEEKLLVPRPDQMGTSALPWRALYILETHAEEDILFEPLTGKAAFEMTWRHTRHHFIDGLGLRPTHFKLVAQAAQQARVVKITRPANRFCLAELIDRIEQDLEENHERCP